MGELMKEKSAMAITGYESLLPIINKYRVTDIAELNMLIEAFETGKKFACKEVRKSKDGNN